MSDKSPPPDEDQQDRSRRSRDFLILTVGAIATLGLLFLTSAIGLVEFITGAIVIGSGAMAYYVGSAPSAANRAAPEILEPAKPKPEPTLLDAIGPFIRSMPFAALLISKEGRIATANTYAQRVLRLPEAENTLLSATLRQPDLLAGVKRVSMTEASEQIEFTLHGEVETWMAHMQTGPEPGSVVVVLEDMTAVKRAERARADFLANASHELRTPLTAVGGFIETMRGPAKNDKASWDGFLEIMFQQTERMKRLVTDLLSLSRIEFSEHRAPDTIVEMTALVQHATLGLEPIAKEAKVKLKVETTQYEIRAIADSDEMIQIIQNLAGNALKYAPYKGKISILVGHAETMGKAAIEAGRSIEGASRALLLDPRASSEVPAIWIRISDNGPGIPELHLPRLGERFYRVDESRGGKIEGTGLGLAIVKHIMARHRGGFAVESKEGEGTAFSVWMPCLDADA